MTRVSTKSFCFSGGPPLAGRVLSGPIGSGRVLSVRRVISGGRRRGEGVSCPPPPCVKRACPNKPARHGSLQHHLAVGAYLFDRVSTKNFGVVVYLTEFLLKAFSLETSLGIRPGPAGSGRVLSVMRVISGGRRRRLCERSRKQGFRPAGRSCSIVFVCPSVCKKPNFSFKGS